MRGRAAAAQRSPELRLALLTVAAVTALYLALARDGAPAASSVAGHGLGATGFLLMMWAAFGYTWRKPVHRRGPARMHAWLRVHVFTGLVGPYLALLHTGFAFHGLAGVLTLLVLVVVASGVIGRYVYTAAPRAIEAAVAAPPGSSWAAIAPCEPAPGEADPPGVAHDRAAALPPQHRLHGHREHVRPGGARWRAVLALWWVLHVPMSMAMFALALVHIAAALYYATLLR